MARIDPSNFEMLLQVNTPRVLPALQRAVLDFGNQQLQGPAVSAMINIMRNYPVRTSRCLCETLDTLIEEHASSQERLEASFWAGGSCIDCIHLHKINKSKILLIQFRMELATYINDPDRLVRRVAIKAFGHLSAALDPDLQWYIRALASSIRDDVDQDVRLAAIDAACQLLSDIAPDLQLEYCDLVLQALGLAICDFEYRQVQAHAASAMINFSENYPQVNLTPCLLQIVRTLLEVHASSRERLERALKDIALEDIEDIDIALEDIEDIALEGIALEDIADMISDLNKIIASRSLLIKFQMELPPHYTWVLILAGLLNQEAE